jgi:hypothetical protein
MQWTDVLNFIGLAATLGIGLLGLLAPRKTSAVMQLQSLSPTGFSEFRATYGGLWIALGTIPLFAPSPIAFVIAGACWAGAALGRLASYFLDSPRESRTLQAVAFDGAVAALLLLGNLSHAA